MDLVAEAVAAADTVARADDGKMLSEASRRFRHVLRRVPDADQVSDDTLAKLRRLTEDVIGAIERRIDRDADPERLQQELAESVYRTRRALEEVHEAVLWRRHFRAR